MSGLPGALRRRAEPIAPGHQRARRPLVDPTRLEPGDRVWSGGRECRVRAVLVQRWTLPGHYADPQHPGPSTLEAYTALLDDGRKVNARTLRRLEDA